MDTKPMWRICIVDEIANCPVSNNGLRGKGCEKLEKQAAGTGAGV